MLRRRAAQFGRVAAVLLLVSGCSDNPTSPGVSSEVTRPAQGHSVCGQELLDGPALPVVYDIQNNPVIERVSRDGNVYLRVSANCEKGAACRLTPSSAATVVREAIALDGLATEMVIAPTGGFTITCGADTDFRSATFRPS